MLRTEWLRLPPTVVAQRGADLLRGTHLAAAAATTLATGLGQPPVRSVRGDHRAVGELDLVARAIAHDLAHGGHRGRAAVGVEQTIADPYVAHRRPPVGRGQRRVQRQCLAQTGPAGDDDELARMQTIEQPVEVTEAGRHAGHHAVARADRLDLVQRRLEQVRQDREVIARAALGHVIHGLLGQVDDVIDVAALSGRRPVPHLRRSACPPRPGGAAPPARPRSRVVRGVRSGRHRRDQRVQVRPAADAAEVAGGGQRGRDRDRIGRLTPAVQVKHGVEDRGVCRAVEVGGTQDLHHVGDGVLGQQHPAEHALLGRDVLRRRAVESPGSLAPGPPSRS